MQEKINNFIKAFQQKVYKPVIGLVYSFFQLFWHKSPKFIKNNKTIIKVKDFINKEKKTKKDWLIITVVSIFVLIIFWRIATPKSIDSVYTYVKVSKGKIISSVSATGEVKSENQKSLTFPLTGRIKKVAVKVGDKVKKGDFLASLDTAGLEAQIKQTKGVLMTAEANLRKIKRGLDIEIQKKNAESAQLALEISQLNLKNAELSVQGGNLSLAISQTALENTEKDTAEAVVIAYLREKNAEDQYEDAKKAFEYGYGSSTAKNSAESAWELAIEQKVQSELSRETQIDTAKGQVASLDVQQKQIVNNYDSSKTQLRQIAVNSSIAQAQLNLLLVNRSDDIKALQGQVLQAQGGLEAAQDNLEKAKIHAPFDGTIVKLAAEEGEFYSSALGSYLEIADLNCFQVEVNIGETDIVGVEPGQSVILNFDAMSDEKLEGKVLKVELGPTFIQGVVNYKTTISLPQNSKIRLGMTVNIEIITAEKNDSIYVPFRAVEEKDNLKFVKVKRNGKLIRQEVKTGIQSDTDIEILDGLVEGDTIAY